MSEPSSAPSRRHTMITEGLARLLERIEQSPEDRAGAFLFGTPRTPDAIILTDRGRICWASAMGVSGRLRELVQRPGDSLGQSLDGAKDVLRRYGAGDVQIGRLLEEHCSESILAMSQRYDEPVWIERSRNYDPKFSLAPVDVFAGLARMQRADLVQRATFAIERFAANASGAAFVRASDVSSMRVVAAIDGARIGVGRIRELADWADVALGAAGTLCANAHVAFFDSKTNGASCVWRVANITCCAWAADGRVLGPVLAL